MSLHSPETILNLLGIGLALSLLGDTALYVVLPTHTAQAGILLADVGLMLSANRAIRIFLNSPYGMLIERLPRRRVLVPSLALGVASTLLYAVPGFWPLLVGRLVWGLAWMGIWLGGSTAVLDLASNTNRGRLVGRFQMWGFIGLGAGALLGGLLVDLFGYQTAFLLMAAAGLIPVVLWALFLPETRPATLPHHDMTAAPVATLPPTSRLPLVAAVFIMGLNWLIFLGVIGALLPLLLQARVGEPNALLLPLATLTGIVSAISQALSLVAAPASGWLSDRSGSRWGLIVAALALGVVALLLAALGSAPLAISGIFLGAITTGVLQTQAVTLAGDYAGRRSGRMMGVLNTVGDLGSAAGPVLGISLLPALGLGGILGAAALALLLVLPGIAWVGWRERSRAAAHPL
ncbi:MAG: MFS transporter [Chloroflexi bacterium]|nr:MFS transporter [Chloroflexota bacterium]